MLKPIFLLFMLLGLVTAKVIAQDTLPRISVKNISNQIIISWKNNYGAHISNINIQRSKDSVKDFTTIGTVLNPLSRENGFVDRKAINPNYFYRVFVAFEGGTYLFSLSHRPVIDSTHAPTLPVLSVDEQQEELIPGTKNPKLIIPTGFVPSKFIYTNKDNNLLISLPDAEKEKFSLQFFNDHNKLVFEIKRLTESFLILEKVNFLRTGWYYYDLYNDGILLEKYKFYIGKDGKTGAPPPEKFSKLP